MTYYEHYQTAREECDLIAMAIYDAAIFRIFFANNEDRLKAIEDAGNKVAHERGWDLRE